MAAIILTTVFMVFFVVTFVAWRRYLWAAQKVPHGQADTCQYSLTDVFGDRYLVNVPHQERIQWLTEVFSRSAEKYPDLTALQIPRTGESLAFAELDARAENVAAALFPFLTGPDQVVAVAMSRDNWQIVAAHLGILKAGGTMMFLDTALPEALISHMLKDAQPVVILTRGQDKFRDLPTLDILRLPEKMPRSELPTWLDDPTQRLATIFYTSGTTGVPKGVECPHAGYVNLALSYADYFDLISGMDATSLTSSLGYDGSISEMYSAWVSGCAVVMLTKEQIRSGPDLVPVLREAEVTVLFCPPVLLTTLTSTPELDLPYPLCRYPVPAGEAFPATLVEPWTRGRRQIINTCGPTEASTDTSRQSLRPGEPITIGSPFAKVTYVILEVDQLRPLPHGEVGELCIGGVHVARGYRNLPEQTAQKFITHPRFGRLFRTGDLCKIDIRTILTSPMQASDWNAVSFGNDCIIGGFLQFHTLENMMLKVKLTDIRDGSAVNFGVTVMGGAVIEPVTTLLPLSMVLKEMHLPTATYEGSPAEPFSGVQNPSPLITQPRPGGGQSKLSGEATTDEESRPTRLTVPDD